MKKILYSVMALAIATMTFTACEDVPEPYPTPKAEGGSTTDVAQLPYQSANLNSGWTLVEVTAGAQPWSKGSSYAQATGYQTWGGSQKSNKAVEGWLVSPAISTVGYENVKLSFNHTIRYANNVSGWQAYHKVYATTNFSGDINTAAWTELAFIPKESPYTDWTLYSSGEIQLPAALVGQEKVYIGFLFKAPADASTTWELQSFKIEEGIAKESEEPTPQPTEELGTADAPLTVAKALELINGYKDGGSSSADAYVKGKIVSVQSYNSQYKSITYYISDDGTENGQLQVYSGKGLNGADFASQKDLNPGATVVVKGQLKKYVKDSKVTPEINQSSTIVSIEGNEGGNVEPDPQPTDNLGTAEAPLTVAKALEIINSYEDAGYSPTDAYVKGKIVSVQGYNDKYKSITYWISDDGTENGQLQVYSGKGLNGADFASKDDLTVGATVIVKGELKKFVKNGAVTPEINQNNQIVYIEGNGGGNEQGGDQGGEASGNSLTVVFGDLGLSEQLAAPITLSDGTTLTFAQEGGKNTPVYHSGTKIIRMYAQNSVTVNAGSKKIASVVFNYDTYNGTAYKGNEAMYGEAGTNKLTPVKDDATVTFNNVNASTLKVVNDFETNSGGTQFRITGVTINYAQ